MLPTIGTRRISHPNQKGERGGGITSSRINNLPVRALQPHLATPSECLVPHFREKQIIHRPTLLQQTSTGSIVVEGNDKEKDATLDGFVLLESTGLALPDDVIYIILTSKRFTKVIENDLVFFTGLLHLDLSENFLDLAPFGCLPNLKELRLACNAIREIYMDDLDADSFPALMLLDLSYNSLTTNSVLALSRIPLLKELDISGNKLTEMPTSMSEFKCLEKLVLENNKFDDIKVFNQLATAPNLRDCFLAYNFLWKFPTTKGFKMLETLDVAFNYFGAEENVEGVLSLSRLRSLVLYGNPLLGPTGEDPHFIYIEDLAEAAWSAAYGPSNDNSNNNNENSAGADGNRLRRTPIEIVTEIPRKRTYIKGQDLGRRLITYRDFTMAVPERSAMEKVGGKLARDWIKEGNNTLFAQAVALAQLQQQEQMGGGTTHTRPRASNSPEGYDELTFLTRPPGEPDPYGDDEEEEERGTLGLLSRDKGVHSNNNNNNNKNAAGGSKSNIADGIVSFSKPNNNHGGGHGGMSMANAVMGRVAEELGLSQQSTGATRVTRAAVNGHEQVLPNISSDLLELRARAGIKSTPASRALSSSLTMGPGIEDADNIEPGVGEDDVAAVTSQQRQPPHQQQAASVPDFLLRRSMTEANSLKAPSEMLAMKTAIRALRFAVRHPLTNYHEEVSRDFMAPLDYLGETASSIHRDQSNKQYTVERAIMRKNQLHSVSGPSVATTGTKKAGLSKNQSGIVKKRNPLDGGDMGGVVAAAITQPTASMATLQQLDQILDTLNVAATHAVQRPAPPVLSSSPLKRPGSSTTGINNLIKMVNAVVQDMS